jgi:hypothetical protein
MFATLGQFGLRRNPVVALEAVRPTLFLPHFIGAPANAAFSLRRQLIIFGCKFRYGFDRPPVITPATNRRYRSASLRNS